jgi:hypothetical protein
VAETGPPPGITDFQKAHADWELAPPDGTPEAQDDIDLPQ